MKLNSRRGIAALAILATATLSFSACSSEDGDKAGAPEPVAAVENLQGKTTSVKLDKGFTDALASLKLTPGVTGKAQLKNGSLVFPISGGNVTYFKPGTVSPYVIGQIQHENSGFSLEAGGTKVEIANLNVDPGVSRVYGDVVVNGEVAATSAFIFQLDGRTLKPLTVDGDIATLQGTKVKISPVAAGLLNDVFKTDAVPDNFLVGIATIRISVTSGD